MNKISRVEDKMVLQQHHVKRISRASAIEEDLSLRLPKHEVMVDVTPPSVNSGDFTPFSSRMKRDNIQVHILFKIYY